MTEKVLDEHILEYIWDETLDRIAQRTLDTYIGGSVGTYSDEHAAKYAESFVILHVSQLIAGSGLSGSQFRRRIKKLMAQGILLQRVGKNSFAINSEVIKWTTPVKPAKPYLLTLFREAFLS